MNLITLLGAAVGSQEFCELLFKDPVEAAHLLDMILTQTEVKELEKTFNKSTHDEFCDQLGAVRNMLCKRPPCPFSVVLPGHQDGRAVA